jgi:hypothetical protein
MRRNNMSGGFRLKPDPVRKYFSAIDNTSKISKFETIWDRYYLCFMAGFKALRLGEEPSAEHTFEQTFIELYVMQRYEIIGALIASEIERQGISYTNESDIRDLMCDLTEHTSPTGLSDEGVKRLNEYADGGFFVIREHIPGPHMEVDTFLKKYYDVFMKN